LTLIPPLGFALAQLCNLRLIPTTPSEDVIKSEIVLLLSGGTSTDSTTPDQTSCEDGNTCTVGDFIQSGVCESGNIISCDDANVCTADSCDVSNGCENIPISCDDMDECTLDTCNQLGGCFIEPRSCDDFNLCTVDSCDSQTGCSNVRIDCDDGLACTTEACVGATGQCGGGINVNNCVIDNTCYANDDVNPANECEFCRADLMPGENILDWSNVADGTSCGAPGQTCQAGDCI